MMALNGLLLLYPFLVHAAVVTGSRWLEFAALVLLACNVVGPWLSRAGLWAWNVLGLTIICSGVFVVLGDGRFFLYTASVLSPLALMWFFARTLLPGQTPLVTRIAESMSGQLSEPVRTYTLHVTRLWVAALAGFALANALLATFATPYVWSLFANFINYFFAGALFVAEWLFRCWYLREHQTQTWREYVHQLIRLDIRSLLA